MLPRQRASRSDKKEQLSTKAHEAEALTRNASVLKLPAEHAFRNFPKNSRRWRNDKRPKEREPISRSIVSPTTELAIFLEVAALCVCLCSADRDMA